MKKKQIFIISLLLIVLLQACTKVPAGYKGIRVYLLGNKKGVDIEELGVGRYYIGINQELYLFPTFTQNYVWTQSVDEGSPEDESISFQTIEGMSVNADIGISYSIDPDYINEIFQKYRRGVDEITDVFLRNMVRDAFVTQASTKKIESIYGAGKAQLINEVDSVVKMQVEDIGIIIEKIYYIGELRLPEEVVNALNAKITATQKAQQRENEIAEAEAEARKKEAEAEGLANSILIEAKAKAEANEIINKSLTKDLIEYYKIEQWNGELPKVTGANSILNFDIE